MNFNASGGLGAFQNLAALQVQKNVLSDSGRLVGLPYFAEVSAGAPVKRDLRQPQTHHFLMARETPPSPRLYSVPEPVQEAPIGPRKGFMRTFEDTPPGWADRPPYRGAIAPTGSSLA